MTAPSKFHSFRALLLFSLTMLCAAMFSDAAAAAAITIQKTAGTSVSFPTITSGDEIVITGDALDINDWTILRTAVGIATGGTPFSLVLSSEQQKDLPYDSGGTSGALNNTSITSLNAPYVETVGDYAFYNCSALVRADLPRATSIGQVAFMNCASLPDVNLPSATIIRNEAFLNCSALTSLRLPRVATLELRAFDNCPALSTLYIGENLPDYTGSAGPSSDLFYQTLSQPLMIFYDGSSVDPTNSFVDKLANITTDAGIYCPAETPTLTLSGASSLVVGDSGDVTASVSPAPASAIYEWGLESIPPDVVTLSDTTGPTVRVTAAEPGEAHLYGSVSGTADIQYKLEYQNSPTTPLTPPLPPTSTFTGDFSAEAEMVISVTDLAPAPVDPTPVSAMKLWVMRARYDGSPHSPVFLLIDPAARTMLINGTDYDAAGTEARTEAGSYPITVTGIDAYSGTKTADFVISERPASADAAALALSLASSVNSGGFGLHAVSDGSSVTITDGGGAPSVSGVASVSGGELNLETMPGVTIIWKASLTGSSPGRLVSVNGGGDIKITGGSIINGADGGTALYCEGGASMESGVVSANGYAASAVDAGGKFTFSGGVITAGGKYGTGIFAVHGVTVTGGKVSAGQGGAAVLSLSDLNFTGGGSNGSSNNGGGGGCDAGTSGVIALLAAAMITRKKQ
ncbi:hypothetical protein FACS1894216_19400 [Synergistales bacterium]|nr:hypothetical protein FACS1894216_19400 [Synergistales bacterium]